jgi:hypothetical protein
MLGMTGSSQYQPLQSFADTRLVTFTNKAILNKIFQYAMIYLYTNFRVYLQ